MIQQDIDKVVALYRENPYWKELFESASGGAKEYLAATFANSEIGSKDTQEYVKHAEKGLTKEECKWLSENLPNSQARSYFKALEPRFAIHVR